MVDVEAALEQILAAFRPLPPQTRPLIDAVGMVLAEDIAARNNVPPFRNSAMDGYAVRSADTKGASWERPVRLRVVAESAAGQYCVSRVSAGEAVRIMTGAPLPDGADAIVRFEETDEAARAKNGRDRSVLIFRTPTQLDNVREAGEDVPAGTVVTRRGRILAPPDLGLLASVGHSMVPVHRRPVVAVLSTGNELNRPDETLIPGAIHDSNSFVLGALARIWGAEPQMLGIARDTIGELKAKLEAARRADLIVTSGGVSLGDFDFVKDVLKTEGKIDIWQVRMKPGKPLAFGHLDGTPLLGLPGNPVAAAVSFILFGRPAILKMLGHTELMPRTVNVLIGEPIDNRGQRRHYVRVRLSLRVDGAIVAIPVGEQGAGVLSSLAAADALLIVPETLERVPVGTQLTAIPLDW